MKVEANNFTIFWSGKAIAYATTAELDVEADTYEVGSATSGDWRAYKKGRKGWTISAGHLFDLRNADVVGSDNYRNGFDLLKSDDKVTVAFGTIDPHTTIEAADEKLTGGVIYSGEVLVRRFTVSAVKGQFVTCQFEAVGCGSISESRAETNFNTGLSKLGTGVLGYN